MSSGGMGWAARPETGTDGTVRLLVRAALLAGPAVSRLLVLPIAGWFFLFDRTARAASGAFLRRALSRPPGPADTWRHFRSFATAILDRVFLLSSATADVDTEGLELVDQLARQRRGCILLGAHLGSFEALRVLARRSPVPIRALMFRENEGALTRVLEAIDPEVTGAVIPVGHPDAMLQVKECLAAGGIVGMLADRTPGGERTVSVPFLGTPAPFPAGPFVVASVLDAPVVLFSAVRTAPGRYRIIFEPFADRVVLRRAHRAADLRDMVARFATRLEQRCRQHPYEWFNFFSFWPDDARPGEPRPGDAQAPAAVAPAPVHAMPAGLGTAR